MVRGIKYNQCMAWGGMGNDMFYFPYPPPHVLSYKESVGYKINAYEGLYLAHLIFIMTYKWYLYFQDNIYTLLSAEQSSKISDAFEEFDIDKGRVF